MGVGGRTIFEAKKNINIHEFETWISYMKKKGMLEPGINLYENKQKLSSQAKKLLELNPNMVIE